MSRPGTTEHRRDDDYPPLEGPAYELRLTHRALGDLGCPTGTAPGDLDAVTAGSEQASLVEKFTGLRGAVPTGTDAPMRNVGRPDVYSLHGSTGDRACTWYDADAQVCWLLGWVPQHDYTQFERRAANDELLPDEHDYTVLEVEREELDFEHRVGPGLKAMVEASLAAPGEPVRRTVGNLLRLDVSVTAEPIDDDQLVDLFITARVPPVGDPPAGWPGRELPTRLAELATDEPCDQLDLDYPTSVPDGENTTRAIVWGEELAVVIRNLIHPSGPTG